jgi:hypothetical protein
MQNLVVQVRVIQKRFGGDASDVEASSAERAALFDAGNLRSMVRNNRARRIGMEKD